MKKNYVNIIKYPYFQCEGSDIKSKKLRKAYIIFNKLGREFH